MSEDAKQSVTSLLSNIVLAITAGWGIKVCIDRPFMSAGFGIFAARGIVGAASYLTGSSVSSDINNLLQETLKFLDRCSLLFYFPLIATEVMYGGCFKNPRLAVVNLIVPSVELLKEEMHTDALFISRTLSLLGIGWCNYKMDLWKNVLLVVPFLINEVIWKRDISTQSQILPNAFSCLVTAYVFTSRLPLLFKEGPLS